MITCRRRVAINARVENAFEYVADWHNFGSFLPMFSQIESASVVRYGVGTSLDTTLALGKVEVRTTLDITEFIKNRRILMKASKGVRLRAMWEFKDLGGRCMITFSFDYDLPPGLAFRQDQKEGLEKDLESSACRSMELLKCVLEHQPPSDSDY